MQPVVEHSPHFSCPTCGASEVYRSRRRNFTERLVSKLGFYPYRCGACAKRFFAKRH